MLSIGVFLAVTSTLPDIVCSARFFKPGKEKSYYHLYICKFDGSSRRQLTFSKKLQMAPHWLDHDHLAYVELDREPQSDGSKTGIHHRARINILNLKTMQTKTLMGMQGTDIYADYDAELDDYYVDKSYFKVSKSDVKRFTPPKPTGEYVDPWTEVSTGVYSTIYPSPSMNPHWKITRADASTMVHALTSGEEYSDSVLTIETNAGVASYVVHGSTIEQLERRGDGKLILVTTVSPNRVDHDSFVYEIDPDAKKIKLVLSKIGAVHVDVKGGKWVGRQPQTRPLVQIPDSGVEWANFLYSGSLQNGKRWTLINGLVEAGAYDIRPTK